MTTSTEALTRETIRVALVELLTVGQHHNAASHTTLSAVGDTRRSMADRFVHDDQRLRALSGALTAVTKAFVAEQTPRDGLAELAAIALGWLDTIPGPRQPDPDTKPAV
ncbi:MAG TPA: hypothetical protein VF003_18630 [Pseudonocardiaceae bacterium]